MCLSSVPLRWSYDAWGQGLHLVSYLLTSRISNKGSYPKISTHHVQYLHAPHPGPPEQPAAWSDPKATLNSTEEGCSPGHTIPHPSQGQASGNHGRRVLSDRPRSQVPLAQLPVHLHPKLPASLPLC